MVMAVITNGYQRHSKGMDLYKNNFLKQSGEPGTNKPPQLIFGADIALLCKEQ